MDLRRSIILVALAVVSYMLILAWNEDYGQIKQVQKVTQSVELKEQTFETNTQPINNSDDFSVPEERIQNNSIALDKLNNGVTTKLIHISTDVLDVKIDLKGGNIVSTTLPNYKTSLGSNDPLSIIEKTSRHYVVESGLFGKNGFDSSKNGPLPTYTATNTDYVLNDNENELVIDLNYKDESGVEVIKRYKFKRDDYLIQVSYLTIHHFIIYLSIVKNKMYLNLNKYLIS